jgi:hypothetical protein
MPVLTQSGPEKSPCQGDDELRITEDGAYRITEDGEKRQVEA